MLELNRYLEEEERRRCAADPDYWIFKYAKTRDEHDPSVQAKAFPDKAYLHEIIRLWQETKMNLWPKSRQIMASWTFCGLFLHDTQFNANRLTSIQSKKEEDSDRLVQRCFTIWMNQPEFLRRAHPAVYTYCHLRFFKPEQTDGLPYSEIWGIPQGGDVLRQHVASGLLIDEAAFQPDLEASIRAAMPMIKGGGRIDCVSSAEPGYFEELVEETGRGK